MSSETPEKAPGWFRALSVILGILLIALAVVIMFHPEIGLLTIVIWIALSLIVSGIGLLVIGLGKSDLSSGGRALSAIAGIAVLAIALIAMVYPDLTIAVVLILWAIGIIIGGAAAVAVGGMAKEAKSWQKWTTIILGILMVILAILVIVWPALGEAILIILLVIGLLIQGVLDIIVGITG